MAWSRRAWGLASAIMTWTDTSIYSRRILRTTPTSFIATTGRGTLRMPRGPRISGLKHDTYAGGLASWTSTMTVFQISSWLQAMFTRKWNERCRNTPIRHHASSLGTWAKAFSKNSSRSLVPVSRRHTVVGDARLETSTTTEISTY